MKKQRMLMLLFLLLFLGFTALGIRNNWPALQGEVVEKIPFLERFFEIKDDDRKEPVEEQEETTPEKPETESGITEPPVQETPVPSEEPPVDETEEAPSDGLPGTVAGQENWYYYNQLNDDEKTVYSQILETVSGREESVWLAVSDDTQVDRIYHGLLKDHPELFWIHNRKEVYKTTYQYRKGCLFTPSYLYNESEMQEIRQSMEQAYQKISGMLAEGADDYEIIRTIYIYLIDETEYLESEHDQNIAGVFWKKQAVCAGYAQAVQYLLDRFGVPNIYVDGSVEGRTDGHAWNMVQLDNAWYYVDATNGDQPEFLTGDFVQLAEHKTTLMDFLCPFPWEYEITYHAAEEFELPECTAVDKNFYVMNQGIFSSYDWQSIYDYCCMRINNNAAVVRFKFSEQGAFEQAVSDWIDGDSIQQVAQYYMRRNGLNQVEYHYGVLKELKTIYFIF